jgi:hypothetical protein
MRAPSYVFTAAALVVSSALGLASARTAWALNQPGKTDTLPKLTGTVCDGGGDGGNVQACIDELADPIQVQQIAAVTPETFDPSCNLTFKVIARGAGFKNVFGWYNVRDDGQKPEPSDLHPFLACGDGVGVERPLDIKGTPEYKGGQPGFTSGRVGFFIATPENPNNLGHQFDSNCPTFDANGPVAATTGFVYYSERRFNPDQQGDDSYIHLIVLQSEKFFPAFYFGWEDRLNGGDDDFNDILTLVTGITCAGGGRPCDVPNGLGVCAAGLTQCRDGAVECAPLNAGSAEACDGLDNDCDGEVDEGELCPPGRLCVRGACVPSCRSGEFACEQGRQCVGEGVCVEASCAQVACDAGQVCRGGQCRGPCDGVTCPGGQECRLGSCVDACASSPPSCDPGYVCSRGVCVSRCDVCTASPGVACTDGQACDGATGLCVEASCAGVACGPGQVCRGGACADACAGAVCPEGQACSAGRCVSADQGGGGQGGGGMNFGGFFNVPGGGSAGASAGASGANGAQAAGDDDDGGCSCRAAGVSPERGGALLFVFGAIGAIVRRRRRGGAVAGSGRGGARYVP